MPWNEPGNNQQDPWGKKNKPAGPPDLDKVLRNFNQKLNSLFGKKKNQGGSGPSSDSSSGNTSSGMAIGLVVIIALAFWAVSGFFIVSPTQKATVLYFGKYKSTVGPGPHWIPALIASDTKVDISTSNYKYTASMLTKNENIIDVALAVHYYVSNPKAYLYNLADPIGSLHQATASALRQVIGQTTLNDALTSDRQVVGQKVEVKLKELMKLYHSGISIKDVEMQAIRPPEPVREAFDDVIKAHEDQQLYINKANAYAEKVVPTAKGEASRLVALAKAYKDRVVLLAKGQVAQYLAILPEYKKAPNVTRERLYLSTMEGILQHSKKVLVDVKNGNSLMYLPLNQLFGHKVTTQSVTIPNASATTATTKITATKTSRSSGTLTRPSYGNIFSGGTNSAQENNA